METSTFDILDAQSPATTKASATERYLSNVESVSVSDGSVSLTRQTSNYTEVTTINYHPSTIVGDWEDKVTKRKRIIPGRKSKGFRSDVQILRNYHYPNGKVITREITPRDTRELGCTVDILYSTVSVNALILGAHLINNGVVITRGCEFNHKLALGLRLGEKFGPEFGEFIGKKQNSLQWTFVNRIHKQTGLKVMVSGYHEQAYRLLGYKNISKDDVLRLGYVDHEEYIEIPDSDTYRWCVSEYMAEGKLKIAPLLYETRFAEVFGAHGSIPWEFDSLEEAEAFAESFGYSCWEQEYEVR